MRNKSKLKALYSSLNEEIRLGWVIFFTIGCYNKYKNKIDFLNQLVARQFYYAQKRPSETEGLALSDRCKVGF